MNEVKIASNLEKSFFLFPNKLIQTSASTFLHAFENKLIKHTQRYSEDLVKIRIFCVCKNDFGEIP
jgi:hypothetical protein